MAVNYRGQFLISMPHIHDDVFHRSVIFIAEHTEQFVLGIIIDQELLLSQHDFKKSEALDVVLKDVDQLEFNSGNPTDSKKGLSDLHDHVQQWTKNAEILPNIDITESIDVLTNIIDSYPEVSHSLVDSYSIWDTPQFNQELKNNIWMPIPFNKQFLSSRDDKALLWNELFESSGVNIHNLSEQMGSA
ncbi:MAG: YqgE/AlgH family protein [Wohlfahrtiimonas sp.]